MVAGPMSGVLHDPGFLIPLALVQAAIVLTVIRALDPFERRPLGLVLLMLLTGTTVAPLLALLASNHVTADFVSADHPVRRAVASAVFEEPSKGAAVLVLFGSCLYLAPRTGELLFDGVNDGMVFGAAAGLGFTITENLFYFTQQDSLAHGITIFAQRSDFFGTASFGHAVYSSWFGAGLGLATWTRRRRDRVALPVIGLGVGIGMHALHNGLVAEGYAREVRGLDFLFLAVTLGTIGAWINYQQRVISEVLTAEIEAGLPVTTRQVVAAASPVSYAGALYAALRDPDADAAPRLRALRHQLVELALSQWRARNVGASPAEATGHRLEIHRLAAKV